MLSRKLAALNYKPAESFNLNDVVSFRNLVSWLEDQKIRQYPIDDRADLRNISSPNWDKAFKKYLQDVSCPYPLEDRARCIDFLVVTALRYEFQDDLDRYSKLSAEEVTEKVNNPSLIRANTLDNLDFSSPEFIQGVKELATMLKIPQHPDHLVTLQAVCTLIKNKLSADAIAKQKEQKDNPKSRSGTQFTLDDCPVGVSNIREPQLLWAAKVLRALYINDLRDLQTSINYVIVALQSITANPKTDSSLGKVGR